jgi:hypothetical protein
MQQLAQQTEGYSGYGMENPHLAMMPMHPQMQSTYMQNMQHVYPGQDPNQMFMLAQQRTMMYGRGGGYQGFDPMAHQQMMQQQYGI